MLRRLVIAALLVSPAVGTAKATHTHHHTTSAPKSHKEIKIDTVRFVGNHVLSDADLKANLINNESSFLGFVGGKYQPKALGIDAMRVRDVYYQHGYLDAQVGHPHASINRATGKATITYRILREGKPYKVSSVRIATLRGVNRTDLTQDVKLKKGSTFNVETLRDDLRSISKRIGDKGYAFARVQPRFRKNSRNKTITVVYTVIPGAKGTINNIRIHGNTKTKDSVIRSYLPLAPGDQYKVSDLVDAQDALGRTGFFESATIRPVRVRGNKVDLDVNVKETKTGQIMGAAGYDSLEGIFIEGSFSEKNLFGSGISAGISGSWSKLKKNGTLSFDDPRVAGTMFGLYGGLFLTSTLDDKDHTYGYDKKEMGAYLGLRRKLTRQLSASIDYNYNDVRYTHIYDTNKTYKYEDYIKSSIGLSLTYNNTDNYYVPRRGIYAKARIEYAGIGSGSKLAKYLKSSLKFAAYYGLKDQIGYDLILRYKMQASYIHDMGFVPEAERLHIGGYYNGVRGYRSASITPTYDNHGGMMSMVNSIEASFSLSEKNQVRLTAFADYGMIGNKKLNEVVKKSVGAQIEWRSPMGDVNFVFAKAIGADKRDKTSSFEFTIGKEF